MIQNMFPNSIEYHCKERDSQNRFVEVGNTVVNNNSSFVVWMGYWSVHHIMPLHFTKKSIWKCDKTKTNLWPTLSSLEWQMRWSKVFQSLIHHRKPKLEKTSTTKDDRSLLDYRRIPLRGRLLQKHAPYCTLRICMQFWVQGSLNFYCKRTLKNLYCKKGGQTRIIKKWIIGVLEPPFLDLGIY